MDRNKQEQIFSTLIILMFSLLALRLLFIQIIKGPQHLRTSTEIRARLIPSTAPRGIIYDRYGKVLATSRPAYAIYILPSELKAKEKTLKKLAQLTGLSFADLLAKVDNARNLFEPILVEDYVPFKTIALLEEEREYLPGISIGNKAIRYYPNGQTAAHVLGHVGEVSREELLQSKNWGKHLRLGDIIGLSGIEKSYDQWLRGIGGGQQIEVDSRGRPIKRSQSLIPIPGQELYLTLDLDLQKRAEDAMGERNGAVIIMDINTGEVLSLVSKPSFDPNQFAGALTKKAWQDLLAKKNDPFHNRALTAYPPGSTFKIVTALASLEERIVSATKQFFCRGFAQYGQRRADCWMAHGQLSFFDGIVHSCNVVFFSLGLQLGIETLGRYAISCGLGSSTGIDLPLENPGLIPTEEWKQENYKKPWYPGDSMNAGIGQGYIQTTPLQMAVLISALASSRNSLMRPYLGRKVVAENGQEVFSNRPQEISRLNFNPKNIDILRKALRQSVLVGTGRAALNDKIAIAGKTGTAEDPPRIRPHSWFVCYAPADTPRIAVAVFLEQGGHGGNTAAPIARDILIWWNEHRQEQKEP